MAEFKERSERKDYAYIGIERPVAKKMKRYKPENLTNTEFLRILLKTWKKASKSQ